MRRTILLACLLLSGWALPALAQGDTSVCRFGGDGAAFKLLSQTLHQAVTPQVSAGAPTASVTRRADAPESLEPEQPVATTSRPSGTVPLLRTARDGSARLSGESVRVLVTLDAGAASWGAVRLRAAARTVDYVDTGPTPTQATPAGAVAGGNDLCRYRFTPVYARLRTFDGQQGSIEIDYPGRIGFAPREAWSLVVALHRADTDAILGYGTVDVEVGSLGWSASVSLGLLLLTYGLLAAVALHVNGRRLDAAALERFGAEPAPTGWRLRQAANPIFITQDASGVGSLGRLQMLAFTLAVAFVFIYIYVRTGAMADLSTDVLKLLGITVAGSVFGRIAAESGSVSTASRIWLKGKGLLRSESARLPTASDLVCSEGEVDIARVQALVFSTITIVALVVTGPRDLGGFSISDEMLYLLGLSQITYVAGKAIPAESVRRLNREVDALRSAERQLVALGARKAMLSASKGATDKEEADRLASLSRTTEEAASAAAAWDGALAAASETLVAVYGEMLVTERLDTLRAAA